jgi:ATP-dependent RNA helicase DeaD
VVISLVDLMQKMELQRIAAFFKINLIAMPTPDDQDVARIVGNRATALLESRLRKKTSLERERMRRFTALAAELAGDPEQMQLLTLLLDDLYQEARPDRLPPDRPGTTRPDETRAGMSRSPANGGEKRSGMRRRGSRRRSHGEAGTNSPENN